MSRVSDRAAYDVPVRLRLIEGDLDRNDTRWDEYRRDQDDRFDRIDSRINRLVWAIASAAIALSTTSVVLVLTVLTK